MSRYTKYRRYDRIYKQLLSLDTEFEIFNVNQRKILNLGFAPGLWLEYMIQKLSSLQNIDEDKISTKCNILNFDILFKSVPVGTSTIQGNIFSKRSHELVNQHFKDVSVYETLKLYNDENLTYFNKEQQEIALEKIAHTMKIPDYRIDLVLSDLSPPLPQKSGFYDHTGTNPYLRYNNNKGLNHSILDSKAVFDLGDAANILTLGLLKPGGK
ncbi:unnamed protein product [Candida verbasci]|uniref:rRNA methyltransferase 2, mitochondrial n=1 Tax=Candida verbasci TaxID=1227364 RepID=A0A9W4XCF1_9ASCO|nr:unnamed protein product [Candida verbasci]